MKKIIYSISSVLMFVVTALSLSACSAGEEDYTPGAPDAGFYLHTAATELTLTPTQTQELTVVVGRTESAQAETLTLHSDNPTFTVPSTVSFEAGESAKTLTIPFNIEIGQSADLVLAVSSEQATTYGADTLKFHVFRDYEWEDAGSCEFVDEGIVGGTSKVSIQYAKGTPGHYRLVAPFLAVVATNDPDVEVKGSYLPFDYVNGVFTIPEGEYAADETGEVLSDVVYYAPSKYPDYCTTTVEGNVFTVNAQDIYEGKLYPFTFSFTWTEKFPE